MPFRLISRVLVLAVFSLFVTSVVASEHGREDKPIVAVVLAGGGAKGAAHIGVLKALEDLNIPIDIITGTSMGAYVGGLYSTGKTADEIERFLHTVDWYSGYQDEVGREEKSIRDKKYEDRFQINVALGVNREGVKAPRAAIQGQNMLQILRETSGNPARLDSFDHLPIRYRSVATDVVSLEQVVMEDGLLVDAMMASMSVPGALPPYEHKGRLLIDGGVTNNMPVDLAKSMGADIVIAVDISSRYKTKEEINTVFDVASQLSNYLVQRSTHEQAELLGDNDILIKPAVGEIETTDFSSMPKAFDEGYRTAMEHKQALSALSLDKDAYLAYRDQVKKAAKQVPMIDDKIIDKVVVENLSHYKTDKVASLLNVQAGETLDTEELEQKIHELYTSNRFEKITYSVDEEGGERVLNVVAKEKEWGPNYLNFRFFLEEDFDTQSQYGLGTSINFTGLNTNGAELRTNTELGTDKYFDANLHFPLFINNKIFAQAYLEFSDKKRSLSPLSLDDQEPTKGMSYFPVEFKDFTARIAIGFEPTINQQLSAGYMYSEGRVELSGVPSYGNSKYDRKGLFAEYRYDTLDSISLPTQGMLMDARYLYSYDTVDSNNMISDKKTADYVSEIKGKVLAAGSIDKHTLVGNIELGMTESTEYDIPINPQDLGGFNHLSGLPRNSLVGANKAYSRLTYRYRWFDNDFGMFQAPVYLGVSAEYGGVWSKNDTTFSDAPLIAAGALFGGIDTPVGPLILSYGRAENGLDSVYLIIGNVH